MPQASPPLVTGGSLAALEAAVVTVVPDGPVRGLVQVVLPLLVGVVAHWWSQKEKTLADLSALSQAVADLQSAAQAVSSEVAQLKVDAVPQSAVDPITAQVQGVVSSLQALVPPAA